MTVSLVSVTPADGSTGVDPSAFVVFVFSTTASGWLTDQTIVAASFEGPDWPIYLGAVGPNWEATQVVNGSNQLVVSVRPIGGFDPQANYGVETWPDPGPGTFINVSVTDSDVDSYGSGTGWPLFSTGVALTATEIAGTELDQYEIDAPIISWRTETRHAEIALWNATGDGAFDNGDPYYPEARAYDEIGDLPSRSGTHDTTIYYVLDLGEEREIDCCLLLGNFDRLTTCTQVRLSVGTAIEFTSSLTIVEWDDPGRRCSSWTLGAGLDPAISVAGRYSARFVRVEIDYAGSGEYPEIWELFLARRWSPPGDPLLPVSIDGASSSVITWDSASGHSRALPAVRERRAATLVWPLIGSTVQDAAQDWGDSIEAGGYPCLMCLRPFSGPEETMLVRVAADVFSTPWTGPLDQRITVDFEEQAPFIARDP